MTNEEAFEIREQPEPTCPMIDLLIKQVSSIEREIKGYYLADEKKLREMVDSVDTEIRSFTDCLNEIRKHVETIRAWGQEWKDVALDLSEQLETCNEL